MKNLPTGGQMLFTELQNFAAFKNYRILKFGKLVEYLIKKDAKIEFSDENPKFDSFERGNILKFSKKHLFPCKKIFHINLNT